MRLRVQLAFICLVISVLCNSVNAQGKRYREYSGFFDSYYFRGPITYTVGFHVTAYKGDLTQSFIGTNSLGFGASIGANYKLWPRIAVGAEFSYFTLSGKDYESRRGISFRSTNMELLAYGRFYFVDETVRVAHDRKKERDLVAFKPYFTTGLGFLLFTPVSTYASTIVDSLRVSEGKKYPGYAPVIPVGLGCSWSYSHRLSFVLEATYRITFTDYLDDVSARGNSPKKDGYGLVSIKAQYCPGAPAKKKKQKLPPPAQYDGPKGTKTWKNTPREKPQPKNNYSQEADTTGGSMDEQGEQNPEENTGEGDQQQENPDQPLEGDGQQPVEGKEEENGWGK
jgi:hypothetical protein